MSLFNCHFDEARLLRKEKSNVHTWLIAGFLVPRASPAPLEMT
jgi:hypothetical protein